MDQSSANGHFKPALTDAIGKLGESVTNQGVELCLEETPRRPIDCLDESPASEQRRPDLSFDDADVEQCIVEMIAQRNRGNSDAKLLFESSCPLDRGANLDSYSHGPLFRRSITNRISLPAA